MSRNRGWKLQGDVYMRDLDGIGISVRPCAGKWMYEIAIGMGDKHDSSVFMFGYDYKSALSAKRAATELLNQAKEMSES